MVPRARPGRTVFADMLKFVMVRFHSILAAILVLGAASQAPAQPASGQAMPASFTVFMSGYRDRFRAGDRHRRRRRMDHQVHGPAWRADRPVDGALRTPVRPGLEAPLPRDRRGTARTAAHAPDGVRRRKGLQQRHSGRQESRKIDKVAADTVVLPNMFFGAFEALALRLASVSPGGQLKAYVAPEAEITIRLDTISDERIQTASRMIVAKRYDVTLTNPEGDRGGRGVGGRRQQAGSFPRAGPGPRGGAR